jgi:hypothetical protein
MKALLVILVHVRHERKFAGRKAHTWVKPFNERVGHDCDGLLNSRTLYWEVPRTTPSSLSAFRKPRPEALGPFD